jgi:uncharacterized protein YjbJ (UPF0337 family)
MSQRIEVSSLGFKLTKEVPSSVEEYNALAPKRENAVLEDAISNVLYRGTLAEFRGSVLEELGKLTGVERAVIKPAATEEDSDVLESEGKWFARIKASKGIVKNEDLPAEWTAIAQKHMDLAAFDPAVKERSSDGPVISKKDLAFAEELFKRGVEKVQEVVGQLSAKLGRAVAFGGTSESVDADKKSVARALADYRRVKEAELAAAQKSEFGI